MVMNDGGARLSGEYNGDNLRTYHERFQDLLLDFILFINFFLGALFFF